MASRERQPDLGSMAPRNVEQITNASQVYEYNAQVPLRYWLRTAAALLKEAEIYMREGDEETTYLLLYRHAHLVLSNLQVHPDSKTAIGQAQLSQAKKDVSKNLKILDLLKPRINQRHERYSGILRAREVRNKTDDSSNRTAGVFGTQSRDPRSGIHQLHGHEHSELAVELAHRERHRRAGTKQEEVKRQAAQNDISRQVQAIQMLVEKRHVLEQPPADITTGRSLAYSYPSVRSHEHRNISEPHPLDRETYQQQVQAPEGLPPPAPPPKDLLSDTQTPPPRPDKEGMYMADAKSQAEPTYTFASSAVLENGAPLRTLFLPPTLRTTFLRIAHANTQANLETCAFLAGTLIANALFVSKLIVPAQVATSDTCEMTNESQLFDYVDNEKDLMVLGWIHTHPTQTCFMSSRDLHTHAGYQMMLAESIAIVCAPSKGDTSHGGDWGVYRLTDPPGKMAILNCDRPGIFHPHDVDNIYTDALRPGHVVEASGLEFEVIDLRVPS